MVTPEWEFIYHKGKGREQPVHLHHRDHQLQVITGSVVHSHGVVYIKALELWPVTNTKRCWDLRLLQPDTGVLAVFHLSILIFFN